jgi:flagellar hook assembly protein FlgD
MPNSTLGDAFPNPSADLTTFTFSLAGETKVHLEIINIIGNSIRIIVDQTMPEGSHKVEWDNCSEDGNKVGAGVYFYRLRLNNFLQTKKLVIH